MRHLPFFLVIVLAILLAVSLATCSRKEPTQPGVDKASSEGMFSLGDTVIEVRSESGQDSTDTGTYDATDPIGGVPCVLPPWPDTVLGVLERAYAERNPELIQTLLADDFEFNGEDGQSWKKDEEVTIHRRMFNPQYPMYGAQQLRLDLSNSEWHLLDSSASTGNHLYVVTCEVELWVHCAATEAGLGAKGPIRVVVRRVDSAPAKWEIVSWYDYP